MRTPRLIIVPCVLVICAVGKPEMVKGSWIKQGAVVIDVGTNSVSDPTKKTGERLYLL